MNAQDQKSETELQAVLRALRFRSAISGLLREANTELELSQKACEISVTIEGYRMAWIGLADQGPEKKVIPICHAGENGKYLGTVKISWADCEYGRGPTGTAIREQRSVICRDFATDPLMDPWREEGAKHGFRSSISLPLLVEGKAIGAFTAYSDQVNYFPPGEVSVLEEAAKDLAYGITSLRIKKEKNEALIQLRIAQEKSESANRLKSQFFDIAAHELRTPITAFSLLLQTSKAQLKKGIPVELASLDRITGQVDRLVSLVDDLLHTSQIDRGEMVLNLVKTNLVTLISECVSNFKNQAPKRIFTFVPRVDSIEVLLDQVRIVQVVVNLLDNALKYSPEPQPIDVKMELLPEAVRVSVSDHGPGISEAQKALIFTRFIRISPDQNVPHSGLGLGLFICHNIIQLHHGKIGFESQPNQGSTFFFELPLKTEQARAAADFQI